MAPQTIHSLLDIFPGQQARARVSDEHYSAKVYSMADDAWGKLFADAYQSGELIINTNPSYETG